jgi:hypothetical protein
MPSEKPNMLAAYVGNECTAVKRHEFSWSFVFGPLVMSVECLWRVLKDGRIALTRNDDGQKFGLPEPVDALVEAHSLLLAKTIRTIEVSSETSDLTFEFTDGTRLELLTDSRGYEAWQAWDRNSSLFIVVGRND